MSERSMTMILHSGDMDKAMAAFIVANGAAAKGMDVTIFATFWGLRLVRKGKPAKARLSRMNMGGMGAMMIRRMMRKGNVAPLEELIRDASELGVRMVACEMTMGLMGVKKEDLMPEFSEIGGVGTYLDAAREGNINLFV
ncbi:MAG: DsrE/DsrF/DrsH-like family protein [Thermoplasmata archaeon]|nr:DsrE/DsrF/DrsH-like family protein [Thermoplasmata archaeon]